jgi:uncharacterized membrane protein YidH (DUF202 family)
VTKLFAFIFWDLRRFFRRFNKGDGYAEWQAFTVICCTEIAAIMACLFLTSLLLGYQILSSPKNLGRLFVIGSAIVVTAINYYMLSFKNRWAQFEAEFEEYSARSRIAGGVGIIAVIIAVAVTTVVSAEAVRHLPKQRSDVTSSTVDG